MVSAKEEVRKILDQLPEEASFEDIQYHIYVRQRIERGLNDVKKGRVLSEAEFEKCFARWLGGKLDTGGLDTVMDDPP